MRQIRRAEPKDAPGMHEAQIKSIREISAKDLDAREIALWSAQPYREDQRLQAISQFNVWVIDNGGTIEGYGYLESKGGAKVAFLNGPYLTGEASRQGFAAKIMDQLLKEAKANGATEMRIDSTIGARRFYLKHGFQDSGEPKSIQAFGIEITRYPMRLQL